MNVGCESGWKEFEGACYKFTPSRLTWHSAKDSCLSQDAFLVTVHSYDEQVFIGSLITSSSYYTWIGGKMGTFEYEWEDGSEFGYTNWYSSEPNYNGECIFMSSYSYEWYDDTCSDSNYYVCKKY